MMNIDDFRYLRQGQQISDLGPKDLSLLKPIAHYSKNHKRALLALHGFSSSPAVFRYLLPKLKHYDAIVCPVLPGHAQSINDFAKVKAVDWLQKSHDACCELTKNYEEVDVLGLSLGGLLACELSKQFSLHHLYLLAPALRLYNGTKFMRTLATVCKFLGFRQLRNAAGNILNPQHAEITYRKLPLTTIIEILSLIESTSWQPPSCPVDLFLGAEDRVISSKKVEHLFIGVPQAKIHWLHNSAHVLSLDNDVDAIVSCINTNNQASQEA